MKTSSPLVISLLGLTFCGGSRDDDWSVGGNSPEIAAAWTDLQAGRQVGWKASNNLDFIGLLRPGTGVT